MSSLLLISGFACADETTIRSGIAKKFPKANVESVTKTSHLGLYEVVVDGQVIYTDENFNYLIDGNIIDTRSMTNVTAARQKELEEVKLRKLAFPFEQLPFEMAFKKVKGDGSRKIAVFSDPDCPYCKRLEKSFTKLDNVTIYIFLYPLKELHPKATDVARAIWCSPDRVKVWDDYMLKGVAPKPRPLRQPWTRSGIRQSKRISGTPTLFFADGKCSRAISSNNVQIPGQEGTSVFARSRRRQNRVQHSWREWDAQEAGSQGVSQRLFSACLSPWAFATLHAYLITGLAQPPTARLLGPLIIQAVARPRIQTAHVAAPATRQYPTLRRNRFVAEPTKYGPGCATPYPRIPVRSRKFQPPAFPIRFTTPQGKSMSIRNR